jgi:subtilase-type serine protease
MLNRYYTIFLSSVFLLSNAPSHAQDAGIEKIKASRDGWYNVLKGKVMRPFPVLGTWESEVDRLEVLRLSAITGPRRALASSDASQNKRNVYRSFASGALGSHAASLDLYRNPFYIKAKDEYVEEAGKATDPGTAIEEWKRGTERSVDFILKDDYKRNRPEYVISQVDGSYIPANEKTDTTSSSYPSGHTWEGFQQAQALSLIFPERGQELISRAIQYGESRVIQKSHFPTDTIGARTAAYFMLANALADDEIADAIAANSKAMRQEIGNICGNTLRQCLEAEATPLYDEHARANFSIGYYGQRQSTGSTSLAPEHFDPQSGHLLRLRFPYLSAEDRRAIIAGTAYPADSLAGWGSDLQNNQSTWGLINLPAAYNGPTYLYTDVTVEQTAGKADDVAGFGEWDIWKNDIAGAGRLTKAGDGTLVLAGNNSFGGIELQGGKLVLNGKNDFSGSSTISNGDLVINGELLSDIDVKKGGQVSGRGRISKMIVGDGGVVAPGNSIGTVSTASIEFRPGSTYEVEVNAQGESDKILVSGQAAVTGGTVNVQAENGNYGPGTRYEILKANGGLVRGGASNGFDAVTSNFAFLNPYLSYDATSVYLDLVRNGVSICLPGSSKNQCSVGKALEVAGSASEVYRSVVMMDSARAAGALDNLSGEIYDAAQSALAMNSGHLRNAINERMLLDGASTSGPGGWMTSWGYDARIHGGNGAKAVNDNGWGVVAGLDGVLDNGLTVGFFAGHGQSRLSDRQKSRIEVDAYHLGGYTGAAVGTVNLRGGASYAYLDSDASREIWVPGLAGRMRGGMNGWQYQIFGEASTDIAVDADIELSPYAGLAHVGTNLGDARETGGPAALHVRGGADNVTFATLGLRGAVKLPTSDINAFFSGKLGFTHAFGEIHSASQQSFAGGAAFPISGAEVSRNAAVLDAKFTFDIAEQNTITMGYRGTFSKGSTDNGVNLRWDVKF